MESSDSKPYKLSFLAEGASLFGIIFGNVVLTILTLGFYYPWANAKYLKFMFNATELDGYRFSFRGTGKEMFFGFLKAIGIVILLYGAFFGLGMAGYPVVAAVLFIGVVMVLVPIAIHGFLKYRLSRTSYRDVFFEYVGDIKKMIELYVVNLFFILITLGFYSPWFVVNLYKEIGKNIRYGPLRLAFEGNGFTYFKVVFVGLLLTAVTFGLYVFKFSADVKNYIVNHFYIYDENNHQKGKFTMSLTGWGCSNYKW